MPSLWTDSDTGGHPWLATPPGAAGPPPAPARADADDPLPAWERFVRPAIMAAACVAAVLAGAAIELLR